MPNVNYFHVSFKTPEKSSQSISKKEKDQKADLLLSNPYFNFDASFIENLNKLTTLDISKSQPYVSLELIDINGKPLDNLNLSFFQKQIDFNKINNDLRYSDRPELSLKSIDITTDQASGYLFYSRVTLNIKVHKREDLTNKILLALLYPGSPLRLTYGWNSENEFLNNAKQTFFMNVSSYDLTISESGQADLTVQCQAFKNEFANAILGDNNKIEFSNETTKEKINNGMFASYNSLKSFTEKMKKIIENGSKNNSNDYKLLQEQYKDYFSTETKTRGKIAKNFDKTIDSLNESKNKFTIKVKDKKLEAWTFHEVFSMLCGETLNSLKETLPIEKIEVVYGNFNSKCGSWGDVSIADFPILKDKLKEYLKNIYNQNLNTISINNLINHLIGTHIRSNDEILRYGIKKDQEFKEPNVSVSCATLNGIMTIFFVDALSEIPISTSILPKQEKSSADVLKTVESKSLPILSLGSVNSFIKTISFSRVTDPNIEAVLLERAYRSGLFGVRDGQVNQDKDISNGTTPLTLPLQGSVKVLGHTAWLPYKAFFLSTGLFFVDAIYTIQKVTHTLDRSGFETTMEIRWT